MNKKKIIRISIISSVALLIVIGLVLILANLPNKGGNEQPDEPNQPEEPHNHIWETFVVEPTCDLDGFSIEKCECGDIRKETIIKAKGHNYINGICTVCGSDDPNYEAHVHTESSWYIVEQPTCQQEGKKEISCTTCQEVLKTEKIEKIDHYYIDGICVLCQEADPNYKADQTASEGLEFELSDDGTYYILTGLGTCEDEDIVIPNTYKGLPVKEIGSYAITENETIKTLYIPENISTIYSEGDSLYDTKISFSIGANSNLEQIIVSSENSNYQSIDGNLYTKDGKKLILYSSGKKETSFDIPNSVTSIGVVAFTSCSSIESITIPNRVESIGFGAFMYCFNLKKVIFEENSKITFIEPRTFAECLSLIEIELPNSITSIGVNAFFRCTSLESIIILNGAKSIDDEAFALCENLKSIEIPDSVTSIGNGAFFNCESLESIEIPSSVTIIGNDAFIGCESLESIEIPSSVTIIGWAAFSSNTTIYCEAKSKPVGWSSRWNFFSCPVVWGYTGE